jgi:hypothetical protein
MVSPGTLVHVGKKQRGRLHTGWKDDHDDRSALEGSQAELLVLPSSCTFGLVGTCFDNKTLSSTVLSLGEIGDPQNRRIAMGERLR